MVKDLEDTIDIAIYAQALNGQVPVIPQATMVPVMPGNIIHSNDISPDEMALDMMKDPGMVQQRLSNEGALIIVQWALTYLRSKSLKIEDKSTPNQQQTSQQVAPSQPADLQTINSQAEAEARRKAEDDEEWTEDDLSEGEADLEEPNQKEGDKLVTKKKVKKGEQKARIAKKGKAAATQAKVVAVTGKPGRK